MLCFVHVSLIEIQTIVEFTRPTSSLSGCAHNFSSKFKAVRTEKIYRYIRRVKGPEGLLLVLMLFNLSHTIVPPNNPIGRQVDVKRGNETDPLFLR